jgi:hypothetical protein
MSESTASESSTALARAQAETQALLVLLSEERPDAGELKDRWYALGLAVRSAVKELREREAAGVAAREGR